MLTEMFRQDVICLIVLSLLQITTSGLRAGEADSVATELPRLPAESGGIKLVEIIEEFEEAHQQINKRITPRMLSRWSLFLQLEHNIEDDQQTTASQVYRNHLKFLKQWNQSQLQLSSQNSIWKNEKVELCDDTQIPQEPTAYQWLQDYLIWVEEGQLRSQLIRDDLREIADFPMNELKDLKQIVQALSILGGLHVKPLGMMASLKFPAEMDVPGIGTVSATFDQPVKEDHEYYFPTSTKFSGKEFQILQIIIPKMSKESQELFRYGFYFQRIPRRKTVYHEDVRKIVLPELRNDQESKLNQLVEGNWKSVLDSALDKQTIKTLIIKEFYTRQAEGSIPGHGHYLPLLVWQMWQNDADLRNRLRQERARHNVSEK